MGAKLPRKTKSPNNGASHYGLDTGVKVHFRVQFMTLQWLGNLPVLMRSWIRCRVSPGRYICDMTVLLVPQEWMLFLFLNKADFLIPALGFIRIQMGYLP